MNLEFGDLRDVAWCHEQYVAAKCDTAAERSRRSHTPAFTHRGVILFYVCIIIFIIIIIITTTTTITNIVVIIIISSSSSSSSSSSNSSSSSSSSNDCYVINVITIISYYDIASINIYIYIYMFCVAHFPTRAAEHIDLPPEKKRNGANRQDRWGRTSPASPLSQDRATIIISHEFIVYYS